MNIAFENRSKFYVSGYSMETSEETLEKDCATLREKYEDKLRTHSNHLYFIAWMSEKGTMIYHFESFDEKGCCTLWTPVKE